MLKPLFIKCWWCTAKNVSAFQLGGYTPPTATCRSAKDCSLCVIRLMQRNVHYVYCCGRRCSNAHIYMCCFLEGSIRVGRVIMYIVDVMDDNGFGLYNVALPLLLLLIMLLPGHLGPSQPSLPKALQRWLILLTSIRHSFCASDLRNGVLFL